MVLKQTFEKCGFQINNEKLCSTLSQVITHLGYVIDSVSFTIYVTDEKLTRIRIITLASTILNSTSVIVRTISSMIGLIVSALKAVNFVALFYRVTEKEKPAFLHNGYEYDDFVVLSVESLSEISW